MINNVNFSKHDPLLKVLRESGYRVFSNPNDQDGTLVSFPVKYDDVDFTVVDGKEVNMESAVSQLERYKLLQTAWTHQNTSISISYDLHEVDDIIDWLLDNWDIYVGVSFVYRTDATKTAADLGHSYLPQEVITQEAYENYTSRLKPFDIDQYNVYKEEDEELREDECAGGACPIK